MMRGDYCDRITRSELPALPGECVSPRISTGGYKRVAEFIQPW
jgi:hypothetical protein